MIARLSSTGVKAGSAKTSNAFRMPDMIAESEMKKMYGNISRLREIVSATFSGDTANPQASALTKSGDSTMPSTVMTARRTVMAYSTDAAKRHIASRSPFRM